MKPKRIGIFGGTFNPVHNGHTDLAQRLVEDGLVDQVWLTLSPSNPLKSDRPGATDADRRDMLQAACAGLQGVEPCFIEFDLPRPSYTITTLRTLASRFPDCEFQLIIGADNWSIFNQWRSPEEIISEFGVIIYPRPGYDVEVPAAASITYLKDYPEFNISSTYIRNNLPGSLDLVSPAVASIILNRNLYAIK